MSENSAYEITIGIECHVQLATKTKLFSEVDNDARGKEPNSCVSPVEYALPYVATSEPRSRTSRHRRALPPLQYQSDFAL